MNGGYPLRPVASARTRPVACIATLTASGRARARHRSRERIGWRLSPGSGPATTVMLVTGLPPRRRISHPCFRAGDDAGDRRGRCGELDTGNPLCRTGHGPADHAGLQRGRLLSCASPSGRAWLAVERGPLGPGRPGTVSSRGCPAPHTPGMRPCHFGALVPPARNARLRMGRYLGERAEDHDRTATAHPAAPAAGRRDTPGRDQLVRSAPGRRE